MLAWMLCTRPYFPNCALSSTPVSRCPLRISTTPSPESRPKASGDVLVLAVRLTGGRPRVTCPMTAVTTCVPQHQGVGVEVRAFL